MKSIVATSERPYPIYIATDYSALNKVIAQCIQPSHVFIITDTHVAPLYLETVRKCLEQLAPVTAYVFIAGEHSKTLETVQGAYDVMLECSMDRSGLVVALGGGVVGDLAGFVASSYMRGVPFIQLPTTLLSQNDSSIGGKVGVDYLHHKNMVGAFYNPLLVYTSTETLQTLPERELISGMSEVIKHAMIYDKALYRYLETHVTKILSKDTEMLEEMTYLSCLVKAQVVAMDLTEKGCRKILNFGHTIGHAIETLSQFRLTHGECVAYGMALAMHIAYQRGMVTGEEKEMLHKLCKRYGLLQPFPHFESDAIIAQMSFDKKKSHGKIPFILLDCIGHAVIVEDIQQKEIIEALEDLKKTCI